MKVFKKMIGLLLVATLSISLMAGCSNSANNGEKPKESQGTSSEKPAGSSEVISDVSATLKLYGPGLFTSVTETGSKDIVTGVSKPGYNVVIERWNELYPNVKLDIETIPWDNWKAAVQTAALSGEVDVLLHGASIIPISEPLTPYLEKDSFVKDSVGMMAMRKNADIAPLKDYVPYGLTVTVNPVLVVVDKEIFKNYGLDVPDFENWTMQDLLDAAKATTGTDPVTGNKTYGMSMIAAGSANKNYIWASRAFNNVINEWGDTLGKTKVNFNNEVTPKVLDYLTELSKYASPDYMEGLDLTNAYTENNELAMLIVEDAYGAYNTIKAAGLEDRFMLAALPKIAGGVHDGITSSHMGDWNMSISNSSKQKDLAWEFMKFMVTDEVVQQWILDTYSIPANKKAADKLKDVIPADYSSAISYVVGTSPLEFSASSNDCYDSSNFGTFANDLTTVLNEMFIGNMDAKQAIELVEKNLADFQSSLK